MPSSIGRALAVAAVVGLVAGCGGSSSPASFAGQVAVPIQIDSVRVAGRQVLAVTMDPIASYQAFVGGAMSRLGRNPSRVEVRSATLRLLPTSTGATKLEDVLAGDVLVSFAMAAPTMYDVASVRSPAGAGPVSVPIVFQPGSVGNFDMIHMCSGYLDVYLGGTLASGFDPATSTAALELVLELVAVE